MLVCESIQSIESYKNSFILKIRIPVLLTVYTYLYIFFLGRSFSFPLQGCFCNHFLFNFTQTKDLENQEGDGLGKPRMDKN